MEDCVKTLHKHSDKSSTEVCSDLDTLLQHLNSYKQGEERKSCVEKLIENSLPSALSSLLTARNVKETDLHTKVAEVVAELAKTDIARGSCVEAKLIPHLLQVLDTNGSELTVQVCRALGNICYENDNARYAIVNQQGVSRLLELLRGLCRQSDPGSTTDMIHLRSVATGFLLNLSNTHEESQEQVLEEGVVEILQKYLDEFYQEEDACLHSLLTLNCLCDCTLGRQKVTQKSVLQSLVHLLSKEDISDDLVETVLELISNVAENDTLKFDLTEMGLCDNLIALVKKYLKQANEESDHAVKTICDLLVIFLTGDLSMERLYDSGNGSLYKEAVEWLKSPNDSLQVAGALAIGNFARSDEHCKKMVSSGLPKDLLNLLHSHSGKDGDIRLQHAVLSALRNLAVNCENKPALLKCGVISSVMPMIEIETYPVVFKLLGLLRMLTDKQEETAIVLGTNKELLTRLIKWCSTDDHPGVKGESQRLLAWLVKNSKSAKVMDAVNEHGGLQHLVTMITSEHAVMQNEAVLALILLYSHLKNSSSETFDPPNLASSLHTLLNGSNCTPETLCNAITFVGQLALDSNWKTKLKEAHVDENLKMLSDSKETCLAASEVLHTFQAD